MKINKFSFILHNILLAVLIITVSLFSGNKLEAATLYVQPASTSVEVNNLFSLKILVNTQDKFVNNAEAVINYPEDLLEVVSLNSKTSIFSLWVEQPVFSNNDGVISFNGGVPTPGFNGVGGQIISVVFKAKKVGIASVTFSGAAVRENDGLGTDILSGRGSAEVVITAAKEIVKPPTEITPPVTAIDNSGSLSSLILSSPTHPDQNRWYNENNATIIWNNPSGVRAIRDSLSRSNSTLPNISIPATAEKRELADLPEGISYFNIRYQNNKGWSGVSSYKLQIDSIAPYDLSLLAQSSEDGKTELVFSAKDDTSGIEKYELVIDDLPPIILSVTANNIYQTILTPGIHEVKFVAFDKAGNKSESKSEINVLVSVAPEITYYTKEVKQDGSIFARGTTVYPNSNLIVTLKSVYGVISDYDVRADKYGRFSFASEPLKVVGSYEFWAAVVNKDSTKGPASKRYQSRVLERESIISILNSSIGYCTRYSLPWMIILIIIAILGWYNYLRINLKYKSLLKKDEKKELANPNNLLLPDESFKIVNTDLVPPPMKKPRRTRKKIE